MAVAIQPHPSCISRGTQTVQDTKRLPSFTARQASANQSHQHRHNRSAVTSHNQLQPDSMAARTSKASTVSIHRAEAHQAARSSEKPASQNSHPNLPTSCRRLQLQVCASVHCSLFLKVKYEKHSILCTLPKSNMTPTLPNLPSSMPAAYMPCMPRRHS